MIAERRLPGHGARRTLDRERRESVEHPTHPTVPAH
jgi:hypothetical protein